MKTIELDINNINENEKEKYKEILNALIHCGGLSGVKNGMTIIHFDGNGNFQGIQLSYWPWRKRTKKSYLSLDKVS